jgi:hypothetical protein
LVPLDADAAVLAEGANPILIEVVGFGAATEIHESLRLTITVL